ncbi:hypothetical protein Cantr_02886 [Candida viswanathii]|uniref:Uncharacterized protein n=1 Tax=Candida viswanathii TaxID=5486 RepID=A0A367YPJ2_9ASCO|nr:hypothetical protein Cantr_02886 [Candida viswanathii]
METSKKPANETLVRINHKDSKQPSMPEHSQETHDEFTPDTLNLVDGSVKLVHIAFIMAETIVPDMA